MRVEVVDSRKQSGLVTTVFTHHDMDRSKDHCIVLPERACKSTSAYAAVCFVLFCWLVFLVLGTLGKHCLKEVLISPFLEHIHTRTFIFPSGKYNPVRFFSEQALALTMCKRIKLPLLLLWYLQELDDFYCCFCLFVLKYPVYTLLCCCGAIFWPIQ